MVVLSTKIEGAYKGSGRRARQCVCREKQYAAKRPPETHAMSYDHCLIVVVHRANHRRLHPKLQLLRTRWTQ
jgi:hypothetical protein